MIIDQNTDLYGVLGYPIGHSLSPTMHNAGFSAKGINAVYMAFETRNLSGAVQGMRALDIKGMSVTIPYKSQVMSMLDEVDNLAGKIGAVNTLVNNNGRIVGYNTDAVGALKALEVKTAITGKVCLLIGAGGAAQAIGYILKSNGANLVICNRSKERGKALAHLLNCPFIPLEKIRDLNGEILINTTPVGMSPDVDQCPVSETVLKEGMVVMDIVYNPLKTRLLSLAESMGCLTIDGLAMFIQQGVEQFSLWTGLEAPIETMTNAVKEALNKSGSSPN